MDLWQIGISKERGGTYFKGKTNKASRYKIGSKQ